MGSSWVNFRTQKYGLQARFETQKYGTHILVYEYCKNPPWVGVWSTLEWKPFARISYFLLC